MPEKKLGIIDTMKFAKEAIELVTRKTNEGRRFNDNYQLGGIEKIIFTLSQLKSKEFKQVLLIYSSYNHGRFILDSVFPKYDNPEPFHSTKYEVDLSDRPIQVLGWAEQSQMKKDGIEEGLIKEWIDVGFYDRAEERGIDLESHFAEFSRQSNGQKGNLLE